MAIVPGNPYTLQNGQTADATQVMANFNSIITNVNNNAANSGANTNITSLNGLTSPIPPSQGGTSVFYGVGATGGSANTQTLAVTEPADFSQTVGYQVTFIAGSANTGSASLNVNATGAATIQKRGNAGYVPLTAGDLVVANCYTVVWDGTYYQLLTPQDATIGIGTIASATTTDLASVGNAELTVSGTTTITSFGSSGFAGQIKYLTFSGILTLTYNATSLILPGAANITTAANDAAVVQYLGSGNWQAISYTRANGQAVSVATAQAGPAISSVRNLKAVQASSTTVTVTADEAIVETALGGTTYKAASLNLTLTITNTGANGMDTGSAPTSGDLSIYLIYNPTSTTFALLGVAGTTSNGSVYSGSHMPSGYTASALVSTIVTNGSAQLPYFWQRDRRVYIAPLNVLNKTSSAATSFAAVSLSGLIPLNALSMSGTAGSPSGNSISQLSGDSSGTGLIYIIAQDTSSQQFSLYHSAVPFSNLPLPLIASNGFYYLCSTSSIQLRVDVTSYTF